MFLVSHALASIKQLCNDCDLAAQGQADDARRRPSEVIAEYTKFVQVGELAVTSRTSEPMVPPARRQHRHQRARRRRRPAAPPRRRAAPPRADRRGARPRGRRRRARRSPPCDRRRRSRRGLAPVDAAASTPPRARGRVLVALDPDALLAARRLAPARGAAGSSPTCTRTTPPCLRDRDWARGVAGRARRACSSGLATRAARAADLVLVADEHVPPQERAGAAVVSATCPTPTCCPRRREPDAAAAGPLRRRRCGPAAGCSTMLDAVARAPGWTLDIVGPVAAARPGPRWTRRLAATGDGRPGAPARRAAPRAGLGASRVVPGAAWRCSTTPRRSGRPCRPSSTSTSPAACRSSSPTSPRQAALVREGAVR